MADSLGSREFLGEFIETYRSSPCLWLKTTKDYFDRNKKDLAYAELMEVYNKVEPTADQNSVVKKISSSRTVCKKELAKVKASLKSGTGTDDIYLPKLWYFPLLQFLNNHDIQRKGKSTADEEVEINVEETEDEAAEKSIDNDNEGTQHSATESSASTSTQFATRATSYFRPPASKRRLNPVEQATTDALHLVGQKLTSLKAEDSFDIFGKHIAERLRKVNPNQFKFAQKLIGDVMFEVEMDSLNRYCKISGTQDPLYQQQYAPYSQFEQHHTFTPYQPGYGSSAPSTAAAATNAKEYLQNFNANN